MIRSVSDSQDELLKNIVSLYCPQGIECDPTYGRGVFYKSISKPRLCYDIDPKVEGIQQADCRHLPIEDSSIKSIMFDPPFIAGGRIDGKDGVMKARYGMYPTVPALWSMYRDSMVEFARVLEYHGILIVKCQDTVAGRMQCLSHVEIVNLGLSVGLFPEDLFILVANHRLIRDGQKMQIHARKYHSYFIVFTRKNSSGHYTNSISIKKGE